jgi:hypothetical protein
MKKSADENEQSFLQMKRTEQRKRRQEDRTKWIGPTNMRKARIKAGIETRRANNDSLRKQAALKTTAQCFEELERVKYDYKKNTIRFHYELKRNKDEFDKLKLTMNNNKKKCAEMKYINNHNKSKIKKIKELEDVIDKMNKQKRTIREERDNARFQYTKLKDTWDEYTIASKKTWKDQVNNIAKEKKLKNDLRNNFAKELKSKKDLLNMAKDNMTKEKKIKNDLLNQFKNSSKKLRNTIKQLEENKNTEKIRVRRVIAGLESCLEFKKNLSNATQEQQEQRRSIRQRKPIIRYANEFAV